MKLPFGRMLERNKKQFLLFNNLPYIVATVPLLFSCEPQQLANVSVEILKEFKNVMDRLNLE